jgi:hypothetical protein
MSDLTERQRAERNLNPHAEARLAMVVWSNDYAFKQRGGCMDFWDSLSPSRKQMCIDVVTGILETIEKNGRATP